MRKPNQQDIIACLIVFNLIALCVIIALREKPKYRITEEGVLIPPNVSLDIVISSLPPESSGTIRFTEDGYLLQYD